MKRVYLAIFLMAVALSGCFYEPSESFFQELDRPDLSEIDIVVDNEGDTIYVYQETTVTFDVLNSEGDLELIEAELSVDGINQQIVRVSGNRVTWKTFPFGSETVFLPVTLNLVARSNSNSLASQLGTEVITISQSYILHSDAEPPAPVSISSAQAEDGIMTVRWEPPTKMNFNHYLFRVTYFNQDGTKSGETRTLRFDKTDALVYEDPTFIGGQVKYQIDLIVYNGIQEGDEFVLNLDPLELSYELDSDEKLILNWTEIPIYNHRMMAEISFDNRRSQEVTDLRSTGLQSDFVIDGFSDYDIIFTLQGTDPDYSLQYSDTVAISNASVNFPAEDLRSIQFSPAINNFYLGYSDDDFSIVRYDATSFEKTGELTGTAPDLTISRNGQYAYSYFNNLRRIVRFDPVSLTEISRFNLEDVLGFRTQDGTMTVTDNHKAVIKVLGDDRLDKFYIIDLNTLTIELENLDCMIKISPDGKYALTGRDLRKYDAGTWSLVATINQSNDICSQQNFAIFEKDGQYKLWRTFSQTAPFNEVSVYSWDASTPVNSTLEPSTFLPEGNIVFTNQDPITSYAGFSSVDDYYIYDVFGLDLKYSVRRSDLGTIYFYDSKILSTEGFLKQIEID